MPVRLSEISKEVGVPGDTVYISGSAFLETQEVKFGDYTAQYKVLTNDSLLAVIPEGMGTVEVSVLTENGLSENTVTFSFEQLTPVGPDVERLPLAVYPNPADESHESIIIRLPDALAGNRSAVRIYNASGHLVFSQNATHAPNDLKVGVQHWPMGLYLVIVESNKGQAISRFIKK
jgi:hypothetical protein